jgi:hypothetical protein
MKLSINAQSQITRMNIFYKKEVKAISVKLRIIAIGIKRA